MDPPVDDQFFQRYARHFTSDRIKCGDDYRLRCIVNDQIDTCHGLESADIAPLAADDPALHFIAGQLYDRDRRLGHMIRGTALYGTDHIFLGAFLGFLFGFCLDLLDHSGRIQLHFIFNNF